MFSFGQRCLLRGCQLVLVGTALLSFPQLASAQSPAEFTPYPEKATDNVALLGGWLENRFGSMVDSCTQKKWDRKVRKRFWPDAPVSVVPARLSARFRLTRNASEPTGDERIMRVFNLGSQSLPALFARVRPGLPAGDTPIDSNLLPNGPGSEALNFSDMPLDLRLVSPHFNGSIYSSACATSISYAFDLSGGYSIPTAGVKAALNGSGSDTATNSLRIVEGVFYSPFAAMWLGTYGDYSDDISTRSTRTLPSDAVEPLKTHAGLIFWRWYAENLDKIDGANGILEYFSGLAVQEENQSASKHGAGISSEFSASLPILSASLRSKASMSSSIDFWSRDYYLAAFRDGRSLHPGSHYMRLPKLAEISEHFAGLQLQAWESSDIITIYNKTPVPIRQYIRGVTAPHCATSNWDVKAADGKAAPPQGLKRRRIAPSLDGQQVPICLFELDYSPSDTDVSGGTTLQFVLVHAKTLTSAQTPVQLRLAGAPATLKSYSKPDWRRLSLQPAVPFDPLNVGTPITAASRPAQLKWRIEYQFDSKGAPGSLIEDSLSLENATTRCTSGEPTTLIAATPVLETRPALGKVLALELLAGVPSGASLTDPVSSPTCQFAATLHYRLNLVGSPDIRTPLTSPSFLYPLPLQTSVAK